jgi:peroxiredoxin Q/BCP
VDSEFPNVIATKPPHHPYHCIMKRKTASLFTLMSLLAFFGLTTPSNALEVGDPAPVPNSVDQDGKAVSFADVYKSGVTLVYFYPKADTPGCTAEACSLRDSHADLRASGVQVIGVSEDKSESQKKFQEKYKLPFTLIADTDGTVAKAFGVPATLGFAKRQSFIIKDGKVAWVDKNASTAQQAEDVRKALASLGVKVAGAAK